MKETKEKWIKDTALLFYQIFSADYQNEDFQKKLLTGGGGNSTLCSTWTQLNEKFIKYRISEDAYNLLIKMIDDNDKKMIIKKDSLIQIPKNLIYKKYYSLFFNNAKGAEKRKLNGKYFHFDHNPSNKKVLMILKNEISTHKYNKEYIKELTNIIKQIQTIDLITVDEDDIRTSSDLKNKEKLDAKQRDLLLKTKFYDLEII